MTAIVADGLVRTFDGTPAVRGVSLNVAEGELFGLVGPDGAGKTTTVRMLAGLINRDSGTVSILGDDPLDTRSGVREQLGLMPQQYSLYGDLSVAENLRFFGQLFCLPRAVRKERIERLMDITRLAPFMDRRANALSGGMYKKLALSCALLHEPRVLLLDEPTNGVDPVSRRELWELIYEFVASGMAVVVSTPYMEEAERCHRVGLLHEGRFIAQGSPRDLTDALEYETYEVRGGDRSRLHAVLETHRAVVASSPAGASLRIVVAPGQAADVAEAIKPYGAALEKSQPDFEDLFLARVASDSNPSADARSAASTGGAP